MPTFVEKNYSKCPLKKRPVHFTFEDSEIKDEPENLCIKKEKSLSFDEGNNKLQVISEDIKTSVIVPTPTYPKLNIQPWSFHIPYTSHFYRSIQQPFQQVLSLGNDIQSPSSPSEGSISPPPHYLHGRSSSVSPPISADIYNTHDIKDSARVAKSEVISHHRYIPYHAFGFNISHPPVSPSYSDSSQYSARSLTPESNGSAPEDLSVRSLSSVFVDRQGCDFKKNVEKEKVAPPRYSCPDCNKSYSTFSGLTKHQQFHCPAVEGNQVKKSFICKDCDKTYVSLGALKMHIRTHTLPCKCTICGKAFSRPWLLQGHIRTHTGEKPFGCQHCHRAFADRSNLRAHLQTHSEVKKYSCSTCSKTFSRMSLLTKHTEGGCSGARVIVSTPSYLASYQEY